MEGISKMQEQFFIGLAAAVQDRFRRGVVYGYTVYKPKNGICEPVNNAPPERCAISGARLRDALHPEPTLQ
jgi:hypothetical protein